MDDGTAHAHPVDERLWIRTAACDDADFLCGNGHSFRGRMAAYCLRDKRGFSVSLSEITEMSPEARYWITGFLHGNEPAPEDMFGPGIHDANDDDPRWTRWRTAVDEFVSTGEWRQPNWRRPRPFPSGTQLPSYVWTRRIDGIWHWQDGGWALADPQPELVGGMLAGTVCAERGRCDLTAVTPMHSVCDDCGDSDDGTVPAEFTSEDWERARWTYVPTAY